MRSNYRQSVSSNPVSSRTTSGCIINCVNPSTLSISLTISFFVILFFTIKLGGVVFLPVLHFGSYTNYMCSRSSLAKFCISSIFLFRYYCRLFHPVFISESYILFSSPHTFLYLYTDLFTV